MNTVTTKNGDKIDVKQQHLYNSNSAPASGKPSASLGFFSPKWMKQDQKITLLHYNKYQKDYLSLDNNNSWKFVTQGCDEQITHLLSRFVT